MSTNDHVIGKILFTEAEIRKRAEELGEEISNEFKGEELVVIGTLKGSIPWMCDLMKCLDLDTVIDFVKASSYGSSTTTSGEVKISMDTELNLYNKYLLEKLNERHPKTLKVCTMLDKPSRRTADFHADYIGFQVEDLFIIGYGLDYDQKYRNLPYISYLQNEGK